jgi:hypothetical protein
MLQIIIKMIIPAISMLQRFNSAYSSIGLFHPLVFKRCLINVLRNILCFGPKQNCFEFFLGKIISIFLIDEGSQA